jgi:benzoylformate decarboxylase/acetolactate synthase-1/2/3 large subunit
VAETPPVHEATALTDPPVDYATMATSMGVRAFGPVSRQHELSAVLEAAVGIIVNQRTPVLVDVVTTVTESSKAAEDA